MSWVLTILAESRSPAFPQQTYSFGYRFAHIQHAKLTGIHFKIHVERWFFFFAWFLIVIQPSP